jgi:hypothetical protein
MHLTKVFLGNRYHHLADIATGADLCNHAGSALLFPSLCLSTGGVPAPETDPPLDYCGERSAMMPKRRRTRAQDRAHRITTERRQNHHARMAQRADCRRFDMGCEFVKERVKGRP